MPPDKPEATEFEAFAVQSTVHHWLATGPDIIEVSLYGSLGAAQIRASNIGIDCEAVRVRVRVEVIET
jgi:hypothetical protein